MKIFTTLCILSAFFFTNSARAQYCTLPGRTPYSTDQPGIINFKLNTINRTSSNVENMSSVLVVTGDSTVLLTGHTYTVTITHNRDSIVFPDTRNNIRVWIDYNNNYKFTDAGETVIAADFKPFGVFTGTFTVPATALPGKVRLRATVKMSSDAGHLIPSPCDSPSVDPIGYHGEMEDYIVRIAAPTAIEDLSATAIPAVVYPNPTDGQFTVELSDKKDAPVTISLYDISGRWIKDLLNEPHQSSPAYSFDLDKNTLPRGVYFIRITSGEASTCHKIIKID